MISPTGALIFPISQKLDTIIFCVPMLHHVEVAMLKKQLGQSDNHVNNLVKEVSYKSHVLPRLRKYLSFEKLIISFIDSV